MSKPIKYVVAAVLYKDPSADEFLVVKRPDDDPELGGEWGLPAVTLRPGELPEQGAMRVCQEKLGCEVNSKRFLGMMFQKRNGYDMFMIDIELVLAAGQTASVTNAQSQGTIYVDQAWVSDPNILMPGAKKGSCCSSIFLSDRNLLDRNEWVSSLEGSGLVG